jgi:hypothetical protein
VDPGQPRDELVLVQRAAGGLHLVSLGAHPLDRDRVDVFEEQDPHRVGLGSQ